MEGIHKLNEVIYRKMVRLYEEERYQAAIDLGVTLLDSAKRLGDKSSEKKALEVLSYASYFIIDYVSAMSYIIQFAKLIEEDGTEAEIIKTYNVFISLYTRQGEYDEARRLLEKVTQMTQGPGYELERVKNENNYGYFYNTFKEYYKAIPHLLEALELAKTLHVKALEAVIHGNLAVAFMRTGDMDQAKKSLEFIFLELDADENGISRAEAYMYRAELLAHENNFEEALNMIKASKVISNKFSYMAELAEAIQIEASIYKRMGDFENAFHSLEEFIDVNSVLSNTAKRSAVTRLKMEYDVNRRRIEADVLRQQNAILEEQNRKIQEQTRELERLNEVLGRQNDDLHQSAIEDYLTGVYNRKYFTLKLQEEFSIAKERKTNIACIIFDIDRFKAINDTYGHLIGDEIIKHVSGICEETLDSDSIIGRFGGDEFMILMIDANIHEAEEKANELRQVLAESPLIVDRKPINVTLSLGVADNEYLSPKTTDELMHIADQGLYVAKEAGRDRCGIYKPE